LRSGATGRAVISIHTRVAEGRDRLRQVGIARDEADLDARLLAEYLLGWDPARFFTAAHGPEPSDFDAPYRALIERRARREPLAYITGRKEFWSLDFVVTPAVLIPRPETELLVELALKLSTPSSGSSPRTILDLGTGSGAIAVSLAQELALARVCAVDVSSAAVEIARLNAQRHCLEERMEFFCGDLFEPVAEEREGFDLIVANPPYIRSGDLAGLAPEIREWGPITALDGGADGLLYYRRIVAAAGDYLKNGGSILLELDDGMGEVAARLFADAGGFESAQVYRDYAGKERVIAAAKLLPVASTREGTDRG